ncbi:TetR/AcrR family transcriptional regulator [Frigidibacter sp. MR17.24]|uniref:TetR/AcrR family transcriptional regulator n=1 Tax=Frigidibacter sp. MR17.24 TaxID=3127345 RepID=UPI0030130F64
MNGDDTSTTRPRRTARSVRARRDSDGSLTIPPGSPPDLMCRVALDLFADQNYSSVTIKDIARAGGMNPSLIYYYFDNKEDLFMKTISRVVEEAFARFETLTRDATSPEALVSQWIEMHVTDFVRLQKVAKMSLDYASSHNRTPLVDRAIRDFYEKEAAILSRTIAEGIRDGAFRSGNPDEMALFISTFLDGALFRNVMFPTFNYQRAIRSMRRIVLDQLRAPAAGETPRAK